MKYLSGLLVFIFAAQCYADGPTTIHGMNASGEVFEIDLDESSDQVQGVGDDWWQMRYFTVQVKKRGKLVQSYEKQICDIGWPKESEKLKFFCIKKGDSPLAGAEYVEVRELAGCKGTLFVCRKGCSKRTPRELIKNPWECDPD